MKLYLLRHGEAVSEAEDPRRPLTDQGRRDAASAGELLLREGAAPSAIFHSGKARAVETARFAADALPAAAPAPAPADGLGPNDPVEPWAEMLADEDRGLLLVGHLPFLERLASLLLCGDPDRGLVHIPTAGLVALGRDSGSASWHLLWSWGPGLAAPLKTASRRRPNVL